VRGSHDHLPASPDPTGGNEAGSGHDKVGGWLAFLLRARALEALQYREFRLLWLGQLTTAIGQWMDQVARGWLLYDLTGSPLQLGLVGMIRIFPLLLLSPIAGTMADRYGRKTQLIASQTANAVANVILGLLILHGGVEPWHVYATGLIASTVQVFQQPARQAMVPESVDRAHLTNAIGLNSIAFNMSRMVGPAVAGAIIAFIGPGGSYLAQAGIYMLSTLWTLQLRLPNRAPTSGLSQARGERFLDSTIAGWGYVLRHTTIRSGMMVSIVISFFGFSVNSLLPVFAKDVLQAGPTGQGALLAAMGVGAVLSAFFVATVGDTLPKGLLMVGGVTLYGLCAIGFSASHWLVLSMAFMLVIGVCNVMSNTLIQTVLQAVSAPEMRGRVMGVYQQHQVLIAIGGLAAGACAQAWGAQPTVAFFGAACAAGALAVYAAVPHVRTIR
jgi:MFS family permease